jgi:site-specific DNA recombinase
LIKQGATQEGNNRQSIRRSALESLVLDGLWHRLMQPEFVEAFITEFQAEVNRIARNRDAEIAARRNELEKVTRKLDALIEAIAEGFRSDRLQATLAALEGRKKALERALTEGASPAPRLHPNLASLYRRKVEGR